MEIVTDARPEVASAAWIADRVRRAVRSRSVATLAVSGGSTAPPMFAALVEHDLPWERIEVWQVDERVAPDGHDDRNAVQLEVLPCRVHPMPVTARDLRAAARRYAARLPDRFDVVHLGLGDDGHTASWPPGDGSVLRSSRAVEVTAEFNGYRRMTLTPPVVNGARARVMLTHGPSKAALLRQWVDAAAGSVDPAVPVTAVTRRDTWCVVDAAARPPG